jgi:hypothetical protein
MPRTVVYRSRASHKGSRSLYKGVNGSDADSYSGRLVKFVPAEVLAFFVPAAANWSDDESALTVIFITGLLATPLYLWVQGRDLDPDRQPELWSYPLAVAAFFAWAVGTSAATSTHLGLSSRTGTLILALAAFLIPLLDEVADKAMVKPRR